MIDVMFFLLATFMLASLTMQNLNSLPVDLPKGNADPSQSKDAITLTITDDGGILLNQIEVTLDTLGDALRGLGSDTGRPVIVAADNRAPNGLVVQSMLRARDAGFRQFLFAVKPQ